jgi:hypothetical protein
VLLASMGNIWASDIKIDVDTPTDFLVKLEPVISLNDTFDREVMAYIQKYHSKNTFSCGLTAGMNAADERLRYEYQLGVVREVASFLPTKSIISYTPIRQLANTPQRPALFKGHYFISQ